MSGQGNVLVGNFLVWEVSVGEMSSRGIVRSGKCPSGKCPLRKCQSGICPRGSVSRGNVQSGTCPYTVTLIVFYMKFLHDMVSQNSEINFSEVAIMSQKYMYWTLKKISNFHNFLGSFCRTCVNSFVDCAIHLFPRKSKVFSLSVCENLPNSSCHFGKHKSVFLQILHQLQFHQT